MIEALVVVSIILNSAVIFLLLSQKSKGESFERLEKVLKDEMGRGREEVNNSGRQGREELGGTLKAFSDTILKQVLQLTQSNDQKLEQVRNAVEIRLKSLQEENSAKLEQMRSTVDEKLHATLEKRLGESFKLVSDRLEQVHKGLGEMQNLAVGVGDLKKVLTNVKTRGIFGEIQLGTLLEQVFTGDQYVKNAVTKKGSTERVEFAVKLPGRDEHDVLLPIDSKFPMDTYQALIAAQEHGDAAALLECRKLLEQRLKQEAADIKEKYLDPPHTTDFGILFLPIESLYAEALSLSNLSETLQRTYHVVIAGPSTLYAVLNSLQMGFRTLTIQKRATEVWQVLEAVRMEFGKFGDILDKTQKKLQEASNTIEDASKKTRTIERRLMHASELPTVAEEIPLLDDRE